jgi:hypothetical protein
MEFEMKEDDDEEEERAKSKESNNVWEIAGSTYDELNFQARKNCFQKYI